MRSVDLDRPGAVGRAVLRITVQVCVISAVGGAAFYALIGVWGALAHGRVGWILVTLPVLAPAVVVPCMIWPLTRARQRHQELFRDVQATRAGLEREVAANKVMHEELRRLSVTDPLTGVLNRRGFFAADRTALTPCQRVLIADVDRFKQVNDRHGHAAGDAVLTAVAAVLSSCAGADAVVARLGGDEFAVITRDDETMMIRIADRLARLQVPLSAGGQLTVSVSVGSASVSADTPSDAALVIADAAMYAAKRARVREPAARPPSVPARAESRDPRPTPARR